MRVHLVELHALAVEHVHAEREGAEHAVELRAHEVRQRQTAVGGAHDERSALVETRDGLAREVVVGQQSAGVGLAVQRRVEQRRVGGIRGHRGAGGGGERGEHVRPRGQLARTVVAVHHRDRITRRRRDEIELVVHLGERAFEHDHREDARAGADVSGAGSHGAGRDHAGARVALGGSERDAGAQGSARVEQRRALVGQRAGGGARHEHARQQVVQRGHAARGERVVARDELGVVVAGGGVDGEHARGIAHAEHLLAGELPVHVPGEGGEEADLGHVGLGVDDGLMQVRDRPAERNVHAQQLGELGGGDTGVGVAPRAEGREQLAVGVEREVAVHHRRDTHRGVALGGDAEALLHVGDQCRVGGLQARPHGIQRVGPELVGVDVLPLVGAGGEHLGVGADQARLDAGGAEFDAEAGAAFFEQCSDLGVHRRSSVLCP